MKIESTIKLGLVLGSLNCLLWYILAVTKGFYVIEVYVYRNYFTLATLVAGIILSIYFLKRKNMGFLDFKEAIKTGLVYTFVFAIILSIFNYIYYHFISPDTIDYFLNEAKNKLIENKVKPQDIPFYLNSERNNFSSLKLLPPILFFGLVSSLISGALMRKSDPNKFSAN
jgi:hypothetical protein